MLEAMLSTALFPGIWSMFVLIWGQNTLFLFFMGGNLLANEWDDAEPHKVQDPQHILHFFA
jgi:hypothetical protein